MGYSCNADCPFCYYKISAKSRQKDKDLTTEQAKKLLRYIRNRGKEVVDLTGGEPTIRGDIFELVSYAKDLGFKEIISNPQNIVAIEWAEKVRKILPKEVLILTFEFINKRTREIVLKY